MPLKYREQNHGSLVLSVILKIYVVLLIILTGANIFLRKIRPIDVVDKISPIPFLIIQGDKDPIIFMQHAEKLYKKAKEPKKIIIIKNGLHAEELYRQNPKEFLNICTSWLKNSLQ